MGCEASSVKSVLSEKINMANYTPVKLAFIAVEPEGGANEEPPIVFAHGLTEFKERWEDIPQTVANATKRKVYAIDARNHGDSDWSDVFNFDCNADDLLHFMDSTGIPKAIIIGHSMGGITGIKTALKAPDRVEKLIVEDMSASRPPPEIFAMIKMLFGIMKHATQQVPNDVDEEAAKKIILEVLTSGIPEEAKSLVTPESLDDMMNKTQLKRSEGGHYSYKMNMDVLEKAMHDPPALMTDNEGVYEGPALFVYGEKSPFHINLDEPNIRKHFPNAELTGIENATHIVHTDCPKEFTEAVLNFILKE